VTAQETQERFNALYAQYQTHIHKRVWCILHDNEATQDVTQNAWLKVWRALPTTETACYAWVYRIASNAAIDYLRAHRSKYVATELSLLAENGEEPIAPERDEHVIDAYEAIDRLSPRDRLTMYLLGAGYTYSEISAHLIEAGYPLNDHNNHNVKMWIARSREHLRRELATA
jgi:RNA polymerase sigma factor (sigma-70 family)